MSLHPIPSEFPLYIRKILFYFLSVRNIFYDITRSSPVRISFTVIMFWQINRGQNRLNQPSSSSTEILPWFYVVVITYKSLFYRSSLGLIITLIVVALWWPIQISVSPVSPLSLSHFVDPVLLFRVGPHYATPSPDWLLRASRVLWLEPCSTPSSWKKS